MKKKLVLLALFLLLIAAFFLFDLDEWLSLQRLQAGQATFQTWFRDSPWLVASGFFLAYVAITALSIPGATIMTLAAGLLFGLLPGTVLVSFASTVGATLAFLLARFLFRDLVQERFGERLERINRGVQKEGAFYLFSLRLVPAFPFFLINVLMALTPIRTFTYYWVSQLGMLPATVVYVNAGTQLGRLQSPGDILTPGLILSFVLLGLFPLAAKRLVTLVEKRKFGPGGRREGG